LHGRLVAVWGLTYKPGTDTLRRSTAIEFCHWLAEAGAEVRAFDPVVASLPAEDAARIGMSASAVAAAEHADALVVCTPWPEFREVTAVSVRDVMRNPLVLDAAGHLHATLGQDPAIRYLRVGSTPR
jgi:UDPglucose 6-dehydrogenase